MSNVITLRVEPRENIWIKKELDRYQWTALPNTIEGKPESKLSDYSRIQQSDDAETCILQSYRKNVSSKSISYHGFQDS